MNRPAVLFLNADGKITAVCLEVIILLVITYDVNTTQTSGAKRLRKAAKICERHGIRVQNSVFEVLVDAAQLIKLQQELSETIDLEQDSVRFYRLGNSYQHKIDTLGRTGPLLSGEPMLL